VSLLLSKATIKKACPQKKVGLSERYPIVRHFGSPAILSSPDGSFAPHGFPCFTLSVTLLIIFKKL